MWFCSGFVFVLIFFSGESVTVAVIQGQGRSIPAGWPYINLIWFDLWFLISVDRSFLGGLQYFAPLNLRRMIASFFTGTSLSCALLAMESSVFQHPCDRELLASQYAYLYTQLVIHATPPDVIFFFTVEYNTFTCRETKRPSADVQVLWLTGCRNGSSGASEPPPPGCLRVSRV